MEPEEKFVGFVQFNQFQDIGFFAEDLRIECCSHFAYLTRKDDKQKFSGNRMNLLLVDPFCPRLQAALLRSYTNFDNEIFNECDFVMNSIIQSN